MAEDIENLYEIIYSGQTSNEDRQEAENSLTELFKAPETILTLFEIIENKEKEDSLRQKAAISLRKCFEYCWEEDIDTADKETVKQNLLNLLSTETNLLIGKNIIESCEIVFEDETKDWGDLFSFIESNRQTPIQLQLTMYLIANAARYFNDGFIEENGQLFKEIAQQGIESQDQETLVFVCEMLGVLISFVSPQQISSWEQQQSFLLEYFLNFLSLPIQGDYYFYIKRVIDSLGDSFQSDELAISSEAILQQLLELLGDEQCQKERYSSIFQVIQYLVKEHAMELFDVAESILKAIIECGAEVFNEDDEESISDMILITSTAGDFAGELKIPKFIKLVQSLAPDDQNDPLSISYSYVLYNSIDECEDDVANDIKSIVETTIKYLNSDNLFIKEIGAHIAVILGDSLEPSQLDIAVDLIKNLMPLIDVDLITNLISDFPTGDIPFTKAAFPAIISILYKGLVRNDMVQEILDNLIGILENTDLSLYHDFSIETISALIFAVEEDILPYANQILPVIEQGISLQEENTRAELIKKQAIVALGMLLRFGSQSFPDQIEDAVKLILESADTEDIEMNHSVLMAIGNLIIAHLDILVDYRDKIIEIINEATAFLFNHVINDEIEENEEKEAQDFNYAIQGFTDTFDIMKWIFKSYNELAPPYVFNESDAAFIDKGLSSLTQWMFTILRFMQVPFKELQTRAIVAGYYGTVMILRDYPDVEQPTEYFDSLISLFHSKSQSVVGKCFSAFKNIIKSQIPIDDKYIEEALEAAFMAISGELEFKKENNEKFDIGSSKSLFKFFKALFRSSPDQFPLEKYISAFSNINNDEHQLFEVSQYIGVNNDIYSKCHSSLKSLTKNVLVKKVILPAFQRFAETFTEDEEEYSAFSVPPSPLESMYLLLQFDPNFIQDDYENVLDLIKEILDRDSSGERFYNATIANAIEFLCINYQMNHDEFDFETWFPLILQKLPLKLMGNEKLSEHIYTVIFSIISSNPDIIQSFGNEFLRIFGQTLGVKDRLFNRFHFSEQTYGKILETVNNLLEASGQTLESMTEIFDDEQSYQRFCTRISQ